MPNDQKTDLSLPVLLLQLEGRGKYFTQTVSIPHVAIIAKDIEKAIKQPVTMDQFLELLNFLNGEDESIEFEWHGHQIKIEMASEGSGE